MTDTSTKDGRPTRRDLTPEEQNYIDRFMATVETEDDAMVGLVVVGYRVACQTLALGGYADAYAYLLEHWEEVIGAVTERAAEVGEEAKAA